MRRRDPGNIKRTCVKFHNTCIFIINDLKLDAVKIRTARPIIFERVDRQILVKIPLSNGKRSGGYNMLSKIVAEFLDSFLWNNSQGGRRQH